MLNGASLDRVRGVDEQVDQHLLDLAFISENPKLGFAVHIERRAMPNLVCYEPYAVFDRDGEVHRADTRVIDARESIQVLDQTRDAKRAFERLGCKEQRFPIQCRRVPGCPAAKLVLQQFQIPDHIRERVVDLVCHSRGEASYRGGTLGLNQALLYHRAPLHLLFEVLVRSLEQSP